MGRAAIPGKSATLGTGRRIPVAARALSLLAPGLALLLAAPAALAEGDTGSKVVGLERLRVEHRILYKEFDRPVPRDMFLDRLEAQRTEYEKSPADKDRIPDLEQLMGDAYGSRMTDFENARPADKAGAGRMADKILGIQSNAGVLAELKTRADTFITKVKFEEAETSFKSRDYQKAEDAYRVCLKARDESIGRRSAVQIVVIECAVVKLSEIPEDDLSTIGNLIGTILVKVEPILGSKFFAMDFPELKDLKDRQNDIKLKTGEIEFRFFTPKAGNFKYEGHSAVADLASAAFQFEPVSGGKPFPKSGVSTKLSRLKFLWPTGSYTVRVFLPAAGDLAVEIWKGVTLEAGKSFTVEVPDRFPEGMVYVHTGGFFIDRFEVTNATLAAVAGGDPLLADLVETGKETVPVCLPDDEKTAEARLRAYEKASGKQVPTDGQWIEACFGGSSTRWPWGDEDPAPDRAVFGPGNDPVKVGARGPGAAPCGAQDMAGNMAEWVKVANGFWLIGGSFKDAARDVLSRAGRNQLKDPMPTKKGRAALADAKERESYSQYFEDPDNFDSGLRMVVPAK